MSQVVGDSIVVEATKRLAMWLRVAILQGHVCAELSPGNKVPLIKKLREFGSIDEDGRSKIPLIHAKETVERVFASILK